MYLFIIYSQNTLKWMKENFHDFVWCLHKHTAVELEPGKQSFIVELPIQHGLIIKGANMVYFMCNYYAS